MVIKYHTKTGEIIATIPESFIKPSIDKFFVQIEEDGVLKFKEGDIQTIIVDGKIALPYNDPLKPQYQIGRCKVKFKNKDKLEGFIEDRVNKKEFHWKKDKNGIASYLNSLAIK